jgi:hypothetical protein
MTLQLLPSEFPYIQYEENFILFFISETSTKLPQIHSAGNCKHTKNGSLLFYLGSCGYKLSRLAVCKLIFILFTINYIFFASTVLVFRIGLDNAPAWDHIIKDGLSKLEEFGEMPAHCEDHNLSMKHFVFFIVYDSQSIFRRLMRHFHSISFSRQQEI